MFESYDRQFIIGPRPVMVTAEWKTLALPEIGYLSYAPGLATSQVHDAAGTLWVLLGLAVQSDPALSSPEEALASRRQQPIEEIYASWMGRWTLIGEGKLHTDATGLLSCFYRPDVLPGAGGVQASSSAGLLVMDEPVRLEDPRMLIHGRGMDWYPLPSARPAGVRRLLPSQVLDLRSGNVPARRLLHPVGGDLTYQDLLQRLEELLVTALRRVSAVAQRVWLPLTAGSDSRLLLAAACRAGIPVETYTCAHRLMSRADLELPPKLAGAVGFRHSIVNGRRYQPDRAIRFDRHTSLQCMDQDRYYLTRGYFDWCREGDVLLRSGVLELGYHYSEWTRLPEHEDSTALPHVLRLLEAYRQPPSAAVVRALSAWADWTAHTPEPELDWRDRFYWEQRLAGWLSAIEQALDLTDAARLLVGNSHTYLAHVLRIPFAVRSRSLHHAELIRRMAPQLSTFPTNPPDTRLRIVYRKVARRLEGIPAAVYNRAIGAA